MLPLDETLIDVVEKLDFDTVEEITLETIADRRGERFDRLLVWSRHRVGANYASLRTQYSYFPLYPKFD